MSGDSETLRIMEVVLTAEIFNQNPGLDINDLTPACREIFGAGAADVKRPVYVSDGLIKRTLAIADAHVKLAANPFIAYEEFGQRLRITALEPAAQWFLKQGGKPSSRRTRHSRFISRTLTRPGSPTRRSARQTPRTRTPRRTSIPGSQNWSSEDEKLRGALDLVIVNAPEEVEQHIEDLVCTQDQLAIMEKIQHAITHREFLHTAPDLRDRQTPLRRSTRAPGRRPLPLRCPAPCTCRSSKSASR